MTKLSNPWMGASVLALGLIAATTALAAPTGTVAFLMPDQASTRYELHGGGVLGAGESGHVVSPLCSVISWVMSAVAAGCRN